MFFVLDDARVSVPYTSERRKEFCENASIASCPNVTSLDRPLTVGAQAP